MHSCVRSLVLGARGAIVLFVAAFVLAASTPAVARSFQYDAAGRLILAVYDDGTALRYTYTHGDNLVSVRRLQLPPAPGSLDVERTEPASARLTWSDRSPSESGFLVMRRAAESSAWTTVATLPPNTVSYTDSGLLAGQNYVYRVAALADTDGLRSAYTSEAAAGGAGGVRFSITSFQPLLGAGSGPFMLSFEGRAQTTYHLESSTTLEPGSWQPEPWSPRPDQAGSVSPIPGLEGPITIYLETAPPDASRYFRIRLGSPD
jgi:YD repeat-containing protein